MMRKILSFLLILLVFFACKEPEARRPKQHSTSNFYKELIDKNKRLIQRENRFLEAFIKRDTVNSYVLSPNGFWYKQDQKVVENTAKPTTKDEVILEYNILDLQGNIIYPKQKRAYKVDKEDFIPALQDGVKLMKKGETFTFVIPSYRGFGIAGDGKNVGVNQPIKSTVTLIDIKTTNNENN